ncbi:adenylate/guanylate cyclase domain-containing protein [Mariprofundus ferrooxydans]|uniref:Adenylate/Guanylate Cyclase n=1 Tax=Mariprofundus ferrooxydans PV-1 TaxID=314345 RepID=Q0EZ20_9PROT|nr:adenylate/guanylate cyclase domain-containing protein [Mariprofundus ferrooxydans]EAU54604.1 Adenylate/Guanylate Cyclase [Mariprofundus ferrooxydans PV-1]KON48789.1 cyclase [Mariprofundus ferrooxydans]
MNNEQATVLVVDDTPENIDVLRGILKGTYKVKVAINGMQALKLCATDTPPDLILLDVMMPGMDGYEVCRKLKEDPRSEGIPVIFVTAKNETRDEILGFEVGGVDYISKPVTPAVVLARVATHLKLRSAYRFIRETFGRYLSEDIVNALIDTPHGLKLGGEKRKVTIMMADLRGFTSIGERLPAETVVEMINIFLATMTDVIQQHQGTIDEFIGDAILVIFGAPLQRADDSLRAIRCAIDMQVAMKEVNRQFRQRGYPEVEMGVGLHTGEVIVGNIGSHKRSKYGVVGRVVNTASRIESYTIGGQILISESTLADCGAELRIDGKMSVMPKGISHEMTLYDIGGIIDRDAAAHLPEKVDGVLTEMTPPLSIRIMQLTEKHGTESVSGVILRAGRRDMHIRADQPCDDFSNIRISLTGISSQNSDASFYAKVTGQLDDQSGPAFQAHATSISGDLSARLRQLAEKAAGNRS